MTQRVRPMVIIQGESEPGIKHIFNSSVITKRAIPDSLEVGYLWATSSLQTKNQLLGSLLPRGLGFSENSNSRFWLIARHRLVEHRTNPKRGAAAGSFMSLSTQLFALVTLPLTVWKNLMRLKNTIISNTPKSH